MDEVTKSIQQAEESGEYYKDSQEWYAYHYIKPFTERSFLMIFAAVLFVCVLVMFSTVAGIHPIRQEIPYMVQTDDSVDYILSIKGIGEGFDSMHNAVASYILKRYVEAYESYDYKNLKDQLNYIYNTSSQQVYSDFYQYMSLENPQSPIQEYQRGARRVVEVTNVSFPPNVERPDRAIVTFKATVENFKTNKYTDSYWSTKLVFNLPDIERIAHEKNTDKIDFIVTAYEVEQVGNRT